MKTIILLDFDCLNETVEKLNVELDMNEFLTFLKSIYIESEVQTAYAYVGINEKLPYIKDNHVDELIRSGCIVRKVIGNNYGINFISDCSQAITMDALRSFYENEATNVILVSNSHKLENLVTLLREKDVIVDNVFYGSFADYDLAIKSSGFINLEDFIVNVEELDNQDYSSESDNDDKDIDNDDKNIDNDDKNIDNDDKNIDNSLDTEDKNDEVEDTQNYGKCILKRLTSNSEKNNNIK